MLQLFREILKPAVDYLRDAEKREWIYVKSKCRNKAPGTPVQLHIAGFEIAGPDAASFLHQYTEIFKEACFDTSFRNAAPRIYCCGANIGLEIFRFKKQYPQASIRAFEADPQIANYLAENVKRNKLQQVEVVPAAVWIENGTLSFRPDGALGGKTGTGNSSVRSIRLAFELAREEKVDLLLVDIEGAELEVLQDCQAQLSKIEKLFVEWHGNADSSQDLQKLLELLSSAGFRYQLNNKLPKAPFHHHIIENGFDAMVEIYATRK